MLPIDLVYDEGVKRLSLTQDRVHYLLVYPYPEKKPWDDWYLLLGGEYEALGKSRRMARSSSSSDYVFHQWIQTLRTPKTSEEERVIRDYARTFLDMVRADPEVGLFTKRTRRTHREEEEEAKEKLERLVEEEKERVERVRVETERLAEKKLQAKLKAEEEAKERLERRIKKEEKRERERLHEEEMAELRKETQRILAEQKETEERHQIIAEKKLQEAKELKEKQEAEQAAFEAEKKKEMETPIPPILPPLPIDEEEEEEEEEDVEMEEKSEIPPVPIPIPVPYQKEEEVEEEEDVEMEETPPVPVPSQKEEAIPIDEEELEEEGDMMDVEYQRRSYKQYYYELYTTMLTNRLKLSTRFNLDRINDETRSEEAIRDIIGQLVDSYVEKFGATYTESDLYELIIKKVFEIYINGEKFIQVKNDDPKPPVSKKECVDIIVAKMLQVNNEIKKSFPLKDQNGVEISEEMLLDVVEIEMFVKLLAAFRANNQLHLLKETRVVIYSIMCFRKTYEMTDAMYLIAYDCVYEYLIHLLKQGKFESNEGRKSMAPDFGGTSSGYYEELIIDQLKFAHTIEMRDSLDEVKRRFTNTFKLEFGKGVLINELFSDNVIKEYNLSNNPFMERVFGFRNYLTYPDFLHVFAVERDTSKVEDYLEIVNETVGMDQIPTNDKLAVKFMREYAECVQLLVQNGLTTLLGGLTKEIIGSYKSLKDLFKISSIDEKNVNELYKKRPGEYPINHIAGLHAMLVGAKHKNTLEFAPYMKKGTSVNSSAMLVAVHNLCGEFEKGDYRRDIHDLIEKMKDDGEVANAIFMRIIFWDQITKHVIHTTLQDAVIQGSMVQNYLNDELEKPDRQNNIIQYYSTSIYKDDGHVFAIHTVQEIQIKEMATFMKTFLTAHSTIKPTMNRTRMFELADQVIHENIPVSGDTKFAFYGVCVSYHMYGWCNAELLESAIKYFDEDIAKHVQKNTKSTGASSLSNPNNQGNTSPRPMKYTKPGTKNDTKKSSKNKKKKDASN